MSFSDKVVIVTGAGAGIGAATAIMFAKEGAAVVIVDKNETKLSEIESKIEENGKKPLAVVADVSIDEDAKRIVDETIKKFGKLDVLVNNAGVFRPASVLGSTALTAFDDIVATNIRAVINLMSLAVPHLVETKGNIVNVSSMSATQVASFTMTYGAVKAAVNHFSRCAASELSTKGVRVNIVSPGPVRTDIINDFEGLSWDVLIETTALKRISEPEEVAEMILFAAKAKGVTGSEFIVDNGCLVMP